MTNEEIKKQYPSPYNDWAIELIMCQARKDEREKVIEVIEKWINAKSLIDTDTIRTKLNQLKGK